MGTVAERATIIWRGARAEPCRTRNQAIDILGVDGWSEHLCWLADIK